VPEKNFNLFGRFAAGLPLCGQGRKLQKTAFTSREPSVFYTYPQAVASCVSRVCPANVQARKTRVIWTLRAGSKVIVFLRIEEGKKAMNNIIDTHIYKALQNIVSTCQVDEVKQDSTEKK